MKTKRNLSSKFILLLACVLCTFLSNGQSTPEILFYKFDTTGTVVRNLATSKPSGTNYATLNGSLSLGSGGRCSTNAVIGSGNASSTDYVNTGWATSLSGSWTVSFISKNVQPSTTLFYIFGDASAGSFRCFTNGVAGANNWWLRGPFTDVPLNGGAIVAETMNTFVYDATAGNIKAYRNDTLVNTVSQGSISFSGSGPFKVIGYSSNVGLNNGGILDNFRFYSRALSASEVAALLNCTYPEIEIKGNTNVIADGDATPSYTDSTDFGNIGSSTSATRKYFIKNSGTDDLHLSGITISGTNSSLYSHSGISFPYTIAPNDSVTFDITFTPTSSGIKTATITVNNDDANESSYDFAVQGEKCVTPVSFTFCPSNMTKNMDPSSCDTLVNYTVTASGNPTPYLVYSFSGATTGSGNGSGSGSLFNSGTTNVKVTASGCGTDSCKFSIIVFDNIKPVIADRTNITKSITSGCSARLSFNETEVVGASPFQDSLWRVLLASLQISARMAPSLSGFTVTGLNSIAYNPVNKKHYAILKVSGVSGRVLGTIDLSNAVCTSIGNLGDNFSSLTFDSNGKLFGATGDGASVPEALYEINPANASKTFLYSMGNGADGEVICYNPDDGYIYHWSGNGTVVFEKMLATNTSYNPINISITGSTNGEIFGSVYQGEDKFLISNISSRFQTITTTGTISSSFGSNPDDLRGLAYYNSDYGISVTDNCPGSVTLTQISGLSADELFPVGVTTNTFVATDSYGNTDTMSFTVTVTSSATSSITATQPGGSLYTGGVATNLYLGYGAQLDTLKAIGLGNNVTWSPSTNLSCSSSCAKTIFTPTAAGNYTFTASSACGSKDITICVKDVRVPNTSGSRAAVYLCHKEPVKNTTQTLAVLLRGIPGHFQYHPGDKLGVCGNTCATNKRDFDFENLVIDEQYLEVMCSPNPFRESFKLHYISNSAEEATVAIYGMTSNLVEKVTLEGVADEAELGTNLPNGIYTVSFIQGDKNRVFRMIKVD